MIPLPKFKQILGDVAKNLSDEEIEKIRDAQRDLAEVVFEQWFKEKHNKK